MTDPRIINISEKLMNDIEGCMEKVFQNISGMQGIVILGVRNGNYTFMESTPMTVAQHAALNAFYHAFVQSHFKLKETKGA